MVKIPSGEFTLGFNSSFQIKSFISDKTTGQNAQPQQTIFLKTFYIDRYETSYEDFIKFKPAAIVTLMSLNPELCRNKISEWLDESKTPFWACRYALLMSLHQFPTKNSWEGMSKILNRCKHDSNRFVRCKMKSICLE